MNLFLIPSLLLLSTCAVFRYKNLNTIHTVETIDIEPLPKSINIDELSSDELHDLAQEALRNLFTD